MILKYVSKIPLIAKWLDKLILEWAKMRYAQQELCKLKRESEILKDILIKEVEKRQKLEEGVKYTIRGAAIEAINVCFEIIKEEYYLIPKNQAENSFLATNAKTLGFKPPILGSDIRKHKSL